MKKDIELNEGQRITKYNEKDDDDFSYWSLFGNIFIAFISSAILVIIIRLFLYYILSIEIEQEFVKKLYVGFIVSLLILRFVIYVRDSSTDDSVELYYFKDYLLCKRIPKIDDKFLPIKIPFKSIEYFILDNGDICMTIKKNGEEFYNEINENLNSGNFINFKLLNQKLNNCHLIVDNKFRSKKNQLVNFLNSKIASN